jgi:NitT/TauT family transport system permease protein
MTAMPASSDGKTTSRTAEDRYPPASIAANRSWWARHGRAAMILCWQILLLVAVIAAWQLTAGRLIDKLYISSPTDVAHRLGTWANDGVLWENTKITIEETVLGFAIGAAVGAVLGFGLALLDIVGRVAEPFVIALYSIPKVAVAPLFIIWFGIGVSMKVLLSAATVFFLVYLNTLNGVRSIDPELRNAARLMNANKRQVFFKVLVPGSMGGLITGLRVAVPYALLGAVVGELVASNRGLGYLILDSASAFDPAGVFAALLVVTAIAMVLNLVVNIVEKRVTRWRPPSRDAA